MRQMTRWLRGSTLYKMGSPWRLASFLATFRPWLVAVSFGVLANCGESDRQAGDVELTGSWTCEAFRLGPLDEGCRLDLTELKGIVSGTGIFGANGDLLNVTLEGTHGTTSVRMSWLFGGDSNVRPRRGPGGS